ncbi:hypothetical protein BpHYR1_032751 [Brachionus plicatilis]|uniref:Uncharacterized protein n=1 Tax=Brachionus plicatilis TaxID=10195 RepID=A0A3M7QU64_BRAPC|nr:hypothetical protein BpHYR1_032751 [Brachionus plicatilis]
MANNKKNCDKIPVDLREKLEWLQSQEAMTNSPIESYNNIIEKFLKIIFPIIRGFPEYISIPLNCINKITESGTDFDDNVAVSDECFCIDCCYCSCSYFMDKGMCQVGSEKLVLVYNMINEEIKIKLMLLGLCLTQNKNCIACGRKKLFGGYRSSWDAENRFNNSGNLFVEMLQMYLRNQLFLLEMMFFMVFFASFKNAFRILSGYFPNSLVRTSRKVAAIKILLVNIPFFRTLTIKESFGSTNKLACKQPKVGITIEIVTYLHPDNSKVCKFGKFNISINLATKFAVSI